MHVTLTLPDGLDGHIARHEASAVQLRAHRHEELEVSLVVRGSARYLLDDVRYELTPGTLTWLLPRQEHVLVDQSADHELWWAVFAPHLAARLAHGTDLATPRQDGHHGQFSRRIRADQARRLRDLFTEVEAAETRDRQLANAGLAYLMTLAWHVFLTSDEVVGCAAIHPAVQEAVRLLRTNPNLGDVNKLAIMLKLTPAHLSRIFKAEVGIPLSRYRNQQRLQRFLAIYGDGEGITALGAALKAGFGSYAQFYRVFTAEMRRPPSTLRQSRRN